jgi:hypothetical protein
MSRTHHWNRRILGLCALAALSASCGCKQCASPYDYCPPTFTGSDSCVPCDARYRAGSILGGSSAYGDTIYEGEYDGSSEGVYEEMPSGMSSAEDGEVIDESGRPAELQLTAEEAYKYETPEYARRPPQMLHR